MQGEPAVCLQNTAEGCSTEQVENSQKLCWFLKADKEKKIEIRTKNLMRRLSSEVWVLSGAGRVRVTLVPAHE